jgi:hypothetical protein
MFVGDEPVMKNFLKVFPSNTIIHHNLMNALKNRGDPLKLTLNISSLRIETVSKSFLVIASDRRERACTPKCLPLVKECVLEDVTARRRSNLFIFNPL